MCVHTHLKHVNNLLDIYSEAVYLAAFFPDIVHFSLNVCKIK